MGFRPLQSPRVLTQRGSHLIHCSAITVLKVIFEQGDLHPILQSTANYAAYATTCLLPSWVREANSHQGSRHGPQGDWGGWAGGTSGCCMPGQRIISGLLCAIWVLDIINTSFPLHLQTFCYPPSLNKLPCSWS